MTPSHQTPSEPKDGDDASADLIRDMSADAPPKDLETVKAASDAVAADDAQTPESSKRAQIERRAYALWEADGGHHGRHEEYWRRAEAEIAAEES